MFFEVHSELVFVYRNLSRGCQVSSDTWRKNLDNGKFEEARLAGAIQNSPLQSIKREDEGWSVLTPLYVAL